MPYSARHITLLPAEELLCELLLELADEFYTLEIWITGGWVRDRLLGRSSSNIDIGLSNMTGRQFATALENFVARPGTALK